MSTVTVSETTGTVSTGFWSALPQAIGPFGRNGGAAGTSVLVATGVTQPFDPAVTSSTGDPYLLSVDGSADPGIPVVIPPGGTATLQVTVTPKGAKGTVVDGVLNLVTTPLVVVPVPTSGELVAKIPYRYTIG